MKGLKFHPDFADELANAIEYYEEASIEPEYNFRIAVNDQIKLVKENPSARSIRYDDLRFARVERFLYGIHYFIDDGSFQIFILILLSDYQNPDKYWHIAR